MPNFFKAICQSMGLSHWSSMGTQVLSSEVLAEKYADNTSHFMDVNGLSVHYRDEGEGPVLVLLHGLGSSLHTWDDWVKQLKGQYRIIRLDLPGFGLTGPDTCAERGSAQYMVNMLDTFMIQLGIDRFFLAGNSLGGYYSWNYAAVYPQKVQKLLLVDACGYPQPMTFWLAFAAFPLINLTTRHMMPRFMLNLAIGSAYAPHFKASDTVKNRYFDMSQRQGNRASYIHHIQTFHRFSNTPNATANVKNVTAPTLLMWGELDHWVPIKVMRGFERDLPQSESVVYKEIGHIPMEELPVQSASDAHYFFMTP